MMEQSYLEVHKGNMCKSNDMFLIQVKRECEAHFVGMISSRFSLKRV